jgi:flavin-binding protein dodecin
MSIAKVIEISATSTKSFEDAIVSGVSRAGQTVKDVKGAWIKSMKVDIENGKISNYRVDMKVTFVLNG